MLSALKPFRPDERVREGRAPREERVEGAPEIGFIAVEGLERAVGPLVQLLVDGVSPHVGPVALNKALVARGIEPPGMLNDDERGHFATIGAGCRPLLGRKIGVRRDIQIQGELPPRELVERRNLAVIGQEAARLVEEPRREEAENGAVGVAQPHPLEIDHRADAALDILLNEEEHFEPLDEIVEPPVAA